MASAVAQGAWQPAGVAQGAWWPGVTYANIAASEAGAGPDAAALQWLADLDASELGAAADASALQRAAISGSDAGALDGGANRPALTGGLNG